jgi:transcription antitermination factor NusG
METEKIYKIHIDEYGTIDMLKSHYPKFRFTKSDMDGIAYFVIINTPGIRDIIGYLEEVD